MRKIPRNSPCPCGSGKKFKYCCWLKPKPCLLVKRERSDSRIETFTVQFDQKNPPDVFFDTNVWIGINKEDIRSLQDLRNGYGFTYRYSITNYVEILSHLSDEPSTKWRDPFRKTRACFQKLIQLCHPQILPSPEMEFLAEAGLMRCLDPIWIPNVAQTALAVELIAGADSLEEVTKEGRRVASSEYMPRWIVDPNHYKTLRQTDQRSMLFAMRRLQELAPNPLSSKNTNEILPWFLSLAGFFLIIRPSSKKVKVKDLSHEERQNFIRTLTYGAGKIFTAHCSFIAHKTINERRKIDPNDLYDAMQLILLRDENRLFVTDEKGFFTYRDSPEVQRVLPWESFKRGITGSQQTEASVVS